MKKSGRSFVKANKENCFRAIKTQYSEKRNRFHNSSQTHEKFQGLHQFNLFEDHVQKQSTVPIDFGAFSYKDHVTFKKYNFGQVSNGDNNNQKPKPIENELKNPKLKPHSKESTSHQISLRSETKIQQKIYPITILKDSIYQINVPKSNEERCSIAYSKQMSIQKIALQAETMSKSSLKLAKNRGEKRGKCLTQQSSRQLSFEKMDDLLQRLKIYFQLKTNRNKVLVSAGLNKKGQNSLKKEENSTIESIVKEKSQQALKQYKKQLKELSRNFLTQYLNKNKKYVELYGQILKYGTKASKSNDELQQIIEIMEKFKDMENKITQDKFWNTHDQGQKQQQILEETKQKRRGGNLKRNRANNQPVKDKKIVMFNENKEQKSQKLGEFFDKSWRQMSKEINRHLSRTTEFNWAMKITKSQQFPRQSILRKPR